MVRLQNDFLVALALAAQPEELLVQKAIVDGDDLVAGSVNKQNVAGKLARLLERMMAGQRSEEVRRECIAGMIGTPDLLRLFIDPLARHPHDVAERMGDGGP